MDAPAGLTRAELALLDRLASEEYGLPSAVLMENAGRGAAEEVLGLSAIGGPVSASTSRVVVLAGPGNNGGDACVLVRHVANAGVEVEVLATSRLEELSGDAAVMRRAVEKMGIPVHDASSEEGLARSMPALDRATVIVDGLLGTGFRGEMRPKIARVIRAVNARREGNGAQVVALDLPSGLDADSGAPALPTVVADLTVTFAAWKIGFDAAEAKPFLGRVVLATIGAPAALLRRVRGSVAGD
jgi:NAD(P)H-hydrate epimerase